MFASDHKVPTARPTFGVKKHDAGAEKVLSQIVSDALVLAWASEITNVSNLIRIGAYEFHENDYQQILIWARVTEKSPEELLSLLVKVENAFLDGTSFLTENGEPVSHGRQSDKRDPLRAHGEREQGARHGGRKCYLVHPVILVLAGSLSGAGTRASRPVSRVL